MDILLGWSKKRSHDMAEVLHEWLPKVLPGVQPWMSEKDSSGLQLQPRLCGFPKVISSKRPVYWTHFDPVP
jgi:hypothetical protein